MLYVSRALYSAHVRVQSIDRWMLAPRECRLPLIPTLNMFDVLSEKTTTAMIVTALLLKGVHVKSCTCTALFPKSDIWSGYMQC